MFVQPENTEENTSEKVTRVGRAMPQYPKVSRCTWLVVADTHVVVGVQSVYLFFRRASQHNLYVNLRKFGQ